LPIARIDIVARRRQRIVAAPFAEFAVIHVRAGYKRIGDGTRHAEIPAGGYFAVAPGQLLHVENLPAADGPYAAVCLYVPHDSLAAFAAASAESPTQPWAVLPAHATLEQAFAYTRQGLADGLPDLLLRHRVAELLAAVALAGFRPQLGQARRACERVRLLLASRPARAWRAEDAARHLAVSPATLRRRLADEASSFRAVLEEVRLTHGLALVQGTTKPLKLIAADCGYASPSRFAARFRERFGTTPSSLRD